MYNLERRSIGGARKSKLHSHGVYARTYHHFTLISTLSDAHYYAGMHVSIAKSSPIHLLNGKLRCTGVVGIV